MDLTDTRSNHSNCNIVQISSSARRVTDADEEVFLLYTRLASCAPSDGSEPFRGLGFLDSHSDTITVRFETQRIISATSSSKPKSRRGKGARQEAEVTDVIEVELLQDKTALRSRKGDTGSVLWRASIDFAQAVLDQSRTRVDTKLFDFDLLKRSRVLELGSGTGLLGVVLGPLVSSFTITDVPALVPLINKNINLNKASLGTGANVTADDLDWFILHNTPRDKWPNLQALSEPETPDLILVIDCVYHPSLIAPLVSTLDYLGSRSSPIVLTYGASLTCEEQQLRIGPQVLVVVELRAEDVVREFLETWLSCEGWEIWSLNDGGPAGDYTTFTTKEGLTHPRYAIWVGWKVR